MRKVKCKRCGKSEDIEKAYLHVHITKSGNKQNKYYCTKECYDIVQNDIYMLKQCQYFVDEVFGYTVIGNQKNKCLKELTDAGYTREEVYDCMLELKSTIIDALEYRKDIEDENQRVLYLYAIVKSKIKQITKNNKLIKKQQNEKKKYEEDFYIEEIKIKKPKTTRKGLMDIIGG